MDKRDRWGAVEADRILRGVLRQNVDAQEHLIGFARNAAERVLGVRVTEDDLQASAQSALLGLRHAGAEVIPGLTSALLSFGLGFLANYAFYLFQRAWLDAAQVSAVGHDRRRALRREAEAQALEMVETRVKLIERCLERSLSQHEKDRLTQELSAALFHAEDIFYVDVIKAIERVQSDSTAALGE